VRVRLLASEAYPAGVLAAGRNLVDSDRADGSATSGVCNVRVFGSLRPALEERGRPYEFTADVPADGITARELAEALELDVPRVEGVFVNHTVHGLDWRIMPGDEIGFVPNDIPGPHRYYLGLYNAGKDAGL
jgi:molybdopterin converting factor small subunit